MSISGTLPFSTKTSQINTSEGDQSPTSTYNITSSSTHDFTVFANVHIQGSSGSLLSQSSANLTTHVTDLSDSSSTTSSSAPELPKRSNSITSLANSNNDMKPILSPRSMSDSNSMTTTTTVRYQPIVSPKCLEPLREEKVAMTIIDNDIPPTISPRTAKNAINHQSDANCNTARINTNTCTLR